MRVGGVSEEEMTLDLSPRGGLSRPRNWGPAVQSQRTIQRVQWAGTQQTGKAQVSDGSGEGWEVGKGWRASGLDCIICPTIS